MTEVTSDLRSWAQALRRLQRSGPQRAVLRLAAAGFHRLGWGVGDQAVSSLTNFAVSAYIAHALGAEQLGAFSLAYVTYGFVLNASRGLATDPLMVRFSGVSAESWRRAVVSCSGTALVVGLVAGAGILAGAFLMDGTARAAFIALGLTFPGLMLQDCWRFCFFVARRGSQAFLNDSIWGGGLIGALLLLRGIHHADVFWFTLAWGLTAGLGAVAGIAQAGGLVPRPGQAVSWLAQHKDLGVRYLLEGTSNAAVAQVRGYGTDAIVGLTAVGYVQASVTLMGPYTILALGMSLVTIPEGARLLRGSTRHLFIFCILVTAGMVLAGLGWGAVMLITVPHGLGRWLVGSVWRQLYPLEMAQIAFVVASALTVGPGVGLHALGAARRSLRVTVLTALITSLAAIAGAELAGGAGTIYGMAAGTCVGSVMVWSQFRKAYDEYNAAAGDVRENIPA